KYCDPDFRDSSCIGVAGANTAAHYPSPAAAPQGAASRRVGVPNGPRHPLERPWQVPALRNDDGAGNPRSGRVSGDTETHAAEFPRWPEGSARVRYLGPEDRSTG